MESYTIKRRRGIDDLLIEWAWRGASQGDESVTNSCVEGLSSEGWMIFNFDGVNRYDQEAVNKEVERRKEHNRKYIEQLKAEGRFGEEFEINIHVKPNPIFDTPKVSKFENARMIFIDNKDYNGESTDI